MRQFGYDSFDVVSSGGASLASVVDRIGEDSFFESLLTYLHATIGAEHCAILAFDADRPVKVGAVSYDGGDLAGRQIDLYLAQYWQHDPTMIAAARMFGGNCSSLLRLDPDSLPPSGLRDLVYRQAHISDRLLLCGTANGTAINVSIVRSSLHGKFSGAEISHLLHMAETLLAVVRKHAGLITRQSDIATALSNPEIIADCMFQAPEGLSKREIEVCARILFGISSLGISLDLNIGEETVKTYRKRAYERLGIATQRELLMWYLRLWGQRSAKPH